MAAACRVSAAVSTSPLRSGIGPPRSTCTLASSSANRRADGSFTLPTALAAWCGVASSFGVVATACSRAASSGRFVWSSWRCVASPLVVAGSSWRGVASSYPRVGPPSWCCEASSFVVNRSSWRGVRSVWSLVRSSRPRGCVSARPPPVLLARRRAAAPRRAISLARRGVFANGRRVMAERRRVTARRHPCHRGARRHPCHGGAARDRADWPAGQDFERQHQRDSAAFHRLSPAQLILGRSVAALRFTPPTRSAVLSPSRMRLRPRLRHAPRTTRVLFTPQLRVPTASQSSRCLSTACSRHFSHLSTPPFVSRKVHSTCQLSRAPVRGGTCLHVRGRGAYPAPGRIPEDHVSLRAAAAWIAKDESALNRALTDETGLTA